MNVRSLIACVLLVTATACDSDQGTCSGRAILPSESPKVLGTFRPLGQGETPDPGGTETVPHEWTLFLTSNCSDELVIEKVCIVGDAHNGDPSTTAFTIEGPLPDTLHRGDVAAVRVTYASDRVNEDQDDDGDRDPDQVAVVVQSNAQNFPTLVIPVCAQIIPANEEGTPFVCRSPVTVPAGTADRTLCATQ